jgi:hypothetical protein
VRIIARLFNRPKSEHETRLFQATRSFNWQPKDHYGAGGPDDLSEWSQVDFHAAETFLRLSGVTIEWKRAGAEWGESTGVKGDPDWFAETADGLFVVGENIWSGFPDPPQFSIVKLLPETRTSKHLGHFDEWPHDWTRDAAN